MKILMLDNYDSFTYNLVQLVRENSLFEIEVLRNDEISLADVDNYDKIILSPGAGVPRDAGIMCEVIRKYQNTKAIFGVCLGMQAIGEVFGANLVNIDTPLHGVSTPIKHHSNRLLHNIPQEFNVGRYHSWALESKTIPSNLEITATDFEGVVMAIEHKTLPIFGVQFHPESILTDFGKEIMVNFLNIPALNP